MKNKNVVLNFINKLPAYNTNLRSINNKLYSYNTCIAEHLGFINGCETIIVNKTKYSKPTSIIQNMLINTLNHLGIYRVYIVDNVDKDTDCLNHLI